MRVTLVGSLLLFAAVAVFAQTQNAKPAFEAATIKLNNSGSRGSSSHGSRGQVLMSNQTLKRLVERAYNVKPAQVAGPAWMEDVHFDIAAKYPADMQNDERPAMLLTLLEERFKLAAHRETREVPGYALVVAKGGFKLKPVEPGANHISSNGDAIQTYTAKKVSMAMLADDLSRTLRETIVDSTGVEGVYDFEFRWRDEEPESGSDMDRSAARIVPLQDALATIGLHLHAQKVALEVIVVDHIERMPMGELMLADPLSSRR
ncbi:MAG TPA: TIGR03435 family protein [Bryobacteraceae bacterium]|nr:TIGR03435 family protein [Bryobacteraceae bacterium]